MINSSRNGGTDKVMKQVEINHDWILKKSNFKMLYFSRKRKDKMIVFYWTCPNFVEIIAIYKVYFEFY